MNRFTGRQITVMVVAICMALVAAPVAAVAATGTFSSASASTPAVSAKNSSSGSGAKAVLGNASAGSGTTYGVYGHAGSANGFGVYSAGRLGSSGRLVCSHCVTAGDVNAANFPTVPNASGLGGHPHSYYARIVPMSFIGTPDAGTFHTLAHVSGLLVYAECDATGSGDGVTIAAAADSDADPGTVNWFWVNSNAGALAAGTPLDATTTALARSVGNNQVEGTATYRRNSDGQVVTIDFHIYGATCEVFGNVLTAG